MTAHDCIQDSPITAESSTKAGYVYLSVSYSMPGFVQIDSSPEDPTDLTWSLRTMSGVTHFRSVAVARTIDCQQLMARFRAALGTDQIPNHSELFKIPIRFARQILEDEARQMEERALEDHAPALPSLPPPPKPPKRKPYLYAAAACAASVALTVSLAVIPGLYASHRPMPAISTAANGKAAAKPIAAKVAPAAVAVNAPAPRLAPPQFRLSGAMASHDESETRPAQERKIASNGIRPRNSAFALR